METCHSLYRYIKRSGYLPQSASFYVIELDFLIYFFIVVKPWLLVQESKVAMQLDVDLI
jgi:hypothetical protein